MRFSSLSDWLSWQETLHPNEIELGLERVKRVWDFMQPNQLNVPVIAVAGTNGKGSSIAFLQSMYLAAGYRVGTYTSPHLYCYNERICIDGCAVDDADLMRAFEHIDKIRGETSLTYFEFGTLAALSIFALAMRSDKPLDVMLLEVGLGGRLDAVNIIDADLALVTSIDLDHQNWLGDNREQIGKEKAGIFRENKLCVISDPDIPSSVEEHAIRCNCTRYFTGRDFSYSESSGQWDWNGQVLDKHINKSALPIPALNGQQQLQNASGAMMVLAALNNVLPVSLQAIRQGLLNAKLAGRFEIRQNKITTVLDVAHNPASSQMLAKTLADYIRRNNGGGQIRCLFSVMADKDITGVLMPMMSLCQRWSIAPVQHPRSASASNIKSILHKLNPENQVVCHDSVAQAYRQLVAISEPEDTIVVFGSFYAVAEAGALTV
ncbi:Dihydrofolate synthase @ Folylpolyglutamate synthase [hydrothermal vent metagenome]|uniref:Dihydrofolate synthase @ Folylpolyglutamate synthase n=1 Tax=hydrothermal vent metagenome TaxID=652676 RepID=A0A3B0ZFT8_9ZZZZ